MIALSSPRISMAEIAELVLLPGWGGPAAPPAPQRLRHKARIDNRGALVKPMGVVPSRVAGSMQRPCMYRVSRARCVRIRYELCAPSNPPDFLALNHPKLQTQPAM